MLRAKGGIASVADLRSAGVSARALQRAQSAGVIARVRRGWYSLPHTSAQLVRAVRVGGSLTCISGCGAHGLWEPWDLRLHVSVPKRSRHLKDPDDGDPIAGSTDQVVVHWNSDAPLTGIVLPIEECLAQVLRCQPAEIAFTILESALHKGKIDGFGRRLLAERVPSRSQLIVSAGSDAESGTESLFQFRMMRLGVATRSQVLINGVGRVDFLIGDRLVVEIDSNAHHGDRAKRLRDLKRDATLAGLGFVYLRFDYTTVVWDWDLVASTVFAVVSRGEHLSPDRRQSRRFA